MSEKKHAGVCASSGHDPQRFVCILSILTGIVLLCTILACSAGKQNMVQDSSHEQETVASSQETAVETETDAYQHPGFSMRIGETVQKDGWTQTTVYPEQISDTFVIDFLLPEDYDPQKSYPAVYLTDCYWRRENYAQLRELYESGKTEKFILVGIGYPDTYDFDTVRVRDLEEDPAPFLDMIVNDVIPYAQSLYSLEEGHRTLCGASLGGFFTIYSLFQAEGVTRDVFENYILASPIFYGRCYGIYLADYEDNYHRRTQELQENVYMSVGGAEDEADMLRPFHNFVRRLNRREYRGLHLTTKVYEGLGHYDVWVPTLLDGLELFLGR